MAESNKPKIPDFIAKLSTEQLQNQLANSLRKLKAKDKQIQELEQQVKQSSSESEEIQSLKQQLTGTQEELDTLKSGVQEESKASAQIQDLVQKLDEAEKKLEVEQQARSHAEGQILVLTQATKDGALEAEHKISSLTQEMDQLNEELVSTRQSYSEASEVVTALKAQVQSFQQALKQLSSEKTELVEAVGQEQQRAQQLDTMLKQARQKVEESQKQKETLVSESEQLQQRMLEMQAKYETEFGALQQQLRDQQDQPDNSVIEQLQKQFQEFKQAATSRESQLLQHINILEEQQAHLVSKTSEIETATNKDEKSYLNPVYVEELESAKAKAEREVQQLKLHLDKVTNQLSEIKSPKSDASSRSQQDSQSSQQQPQREQIPYDELRKELNRVTFELKDLQRKEGTAQEIIKEQRERVHELEFELHDLQAQAHSETTWNRQRMQELETALNTARADAEQAEDLAVQVHELETQLMETQEKLEQQQPMRHQSQPSVDLSVGDYQERVLELEEMVAMLKPLQEEVEQLRRQVVDLEQQRSSLSQEVLQLSEGSPPSDLIQVLQDRIQELTQQLQDTQQVEPSNDDSTQVKDNISQLQKELETSNQQYQDILSKYNDLQDLLKSKKSSDDAATQQLTVLSEERDDLKLQLQDLNHSLISQTEELQRQLSESHTQVQSLHEQNSTIQQQLTEKQSQLSSKEKHLAQKSSEVDLLKQNHADALNQSSHTFQQRIEDLQRQISELQSEKSHIEQSEQEAAQRLKISKDRIAELDIIIKDLQSEQHEQNKSKSSNLDQLQQVELENSKLRDENAKLQREHDLDKAKMKRALGEMKRKLDQSKEEQKKVEIAYAEQRGKYQAERDSWKNEVSHTGQQAESLKGQLAIVQKELSDYKSRAHMLLKAKEEEIEKVRTSAGANEELSGALQASQFEVKQLRQKQIDLQKEIEEAYKDRQHQIEQMQMHYEKRLLEIESNLSEAESRAEKAATESKEWHKRASDLEAQVTQLQFNINYHQEHNQENHNQAKLTDQSKRILELETRLQGLQQDFSAYRETNERMADAKEEEMQRLLEKNAHLRQQLAAPQFSTSGPLPHDSGVLTNATNITPRTQTPQPLREASIIESVLSGQDFNGTDPINSAYPSGVLGSIMDTTQSVDHQQLIELALRQADRDEALEAMRRRKEELEQEVQDLEREVELRAEQERVLKQTLREMEMEQLQVKSTHFSANHNGSKQQPVEEVGKLSHSDSEQVDLQYLKNVIIKMMETNQAEALLPVISTLLGFTSEEMKHCKDVLAQQKKEEEVPLPAAAAAVDMGLQYSSQLFSWAFRPSR